MSASLILVIDPLTHPSFSCCCCFSSAELSLYDERALTDSMEKIEVLTYHQMQLHNGIRFKCYNAGHVLGACMFLIEIAGVKVFPPVFIHIFRY